MITDEQAAEYLASVGVALPDFLLTALVAQVNSINECLEENYTPGVALLIQSYLLGLLALAQGDRYVSSESAPNGASRSYRFMGYADRWRGLLNLLRGLDTAGCADMLIPVDPSATAHAGLWVAKGGCH